MRADVAFMALIRHVAGIAGILIFMGPALPGAAAADAISVILDQARIAKLPDHTSTVVVGNPLIADVSIQAGGTMVVTGKGYGVTNLIALDRTGKVIGEQLVQVKSPADSVVVYRGIARESYSCKPDCERRITLGDTPEYFDATLAETGNRNTRAQQGQAIGGGVR
jgi:Flp pilus assembly secretin CpaC